MVLLPVVDSLERRGLSRPLTSIVLVGSDREHGGDNRGPDRSPNLLGRADE